MLNCGKIRQHSFEANQVIWSKGSHVESWHFIVSGLIAASMPTSSTEAIPVALYGAKTWFGEQSIINTKPSFANYVTLTPVDVIALDANIVRSLLDTDASFATNVAKLMAWRAQKTSETLTLMKLGSPCLRVVMGICQFAETLMYSADRPPTIGFGEGVEIPVKQEVIASLCGVSRSRFSRFAKQLELNGWLRISYGGLEILSLNTWQRFSNLQRKRTFGKLDPSIEELLAELNSCGAL
jgi:CRP-like cAMP-binding protein